MILVILFGSIVGLVSVLDEAAEVGTDDPEVTGAFTSLHVQIKKMYQELVPQLPLTARIRKVRLQEPIL